MSYQSRSIVGFGQLLATLARGVLSGAPLPATLDLIRDHFSAEAVFAALSCGRGEETVFPDSRADAAPGRDGLRGRAGCLREMARSHPHVAVTGRDDRGGSTEVTLWIFRPCGGGRFDNEETALAGLVATQIAQSLDVAARLDAAETDARNAGAALERLGVGVLLVDAAGRVMRGSPVAQRLLAANLGLSVHAGRLRAGLAAEDRALRAQLAALAGGTGPAEPPALLLTGEAGERTLGLILRRLDARPGPADGEPLFAIYLRDAAADPVIDGELARQLFDLTPAEAAVTRRLAAGLSLKEAAESLAISRNTARAHLRSIFSKNRISRQTDLVRLVLNSAVMLGGPAPALARS